MTFAPLSAALEKYAEKDMARFHMPGHKGRLEGALSAAAPYDITEVAGADSLYESAGPIAAMEARYAELYGAGASLLSAGGSTLCIQAMITLAVPEGGSLVIGRGCHRSAVNTMALLDIAPIWLTEQTPAAIAAALAAHPEAKTVYVTSPDYYGLMADLAACSKTAHEHGAVLIVDNAHGAHLKFTPRDTHPMTLGADMCCDSLHKSLPVLTGGALLHLKDGTLRDSAKRSMALFGSSSPSYLVMMSADRCLDYLSGPAREDFAKLTRRMDSVRALAAKQGLAPLLDCEPARLSLSVAASCLSAADFAARLRFYGIEPEYVNSERAVLMASPFNSERDFSRLADCLQNSMGNGAASDPFVPQKLPAAAMSLRDAVFAKSETVDAAASLGRTDASLSAPCPPCIALAAPGEIIDEDTVKLFKKYGVLKINVVICKQ